jgi:colicin import membrane protein
MRAQGRERWVPVLLSVLVHGSILAALGWGWWTYRRPVQSPHTLAIQGTVVRAVAPKPVVAQPVPAAEQTAPVAVPVPKPVETPPPPAPDPARLLAEQQAAAAKAAQERQAVAERAEEQATAEREARKRAEAAQAAKIEAEKQAKAEADRQAKAAADRAAEKRAEADKQARQNEINSQLAAEERLNAARANGQQDQYIAMIKSHVERQWIKPPGIPAQMECDVDVRQVPGGEVTSVHFASCSASAVVRQSIEDAIYRASPLPAPPSADLFAPLVTLVFVGTE